MAQESPDALSAHKTLISLGVILVVMVVMVEVAGAGKQAANVALLLLLGVVLLLGYQEGARFTKFSQTYPWTP